MQISLSQPCAQHCGGGHGGWGKGGRVERPRTGPQEIRESASTVRVSSKTDLTVETAEGDRITISLEARAQLSAAARQGRDGGGASYASASSQSRIEIGVQGQLSEAELADLTELIGALSGEGGEDGLDIGTIASFDFQQTRTVEAGSLFRYAA